MSASELLPPFEAARQLVSLLSPVATHRVLLTEAAGRVLAEDARADRDLPPLDQSAMDGYAVRLADLQAGTLRVTDEAPPGQPPLDMPAGPGCIRVLTGGCVPRGADAVIPRERVQESADAITIPPTLQPKPGEFIRRQGEAARQGDLALRAGNALTGPAVAALAGVGVSEPVVFGKVRVAVLTTGDEVLSPSATPLPWQVRDSNAAAAGAMLSPVPWIELVATGHCRDDRAMLIDVTEELLEESDVLLITGGVSMGDYDHTPDVVQSAGCRVIYHRLLMRPGKPNLGALGPAGQAVLGLPGNPQSVLAAMAVLVSPVSRARAGFASPFQSRAVVAFDPGRDQRTLGMWWYRPATLGADGVARPSGFASSGDTAGPAQSDGLIEVPPDALPAGRYAFLPWTLQ